MTHVRYFTLLLLFACLPHLQAQDISSIAKSDPLLITGAVGTQNTYYYSSLGHGYASPLSNMVYLNMNISVYGFSMPFSFYYTNDNLDFNYPQLSFSLNPRYKNWTGYLGSGSMDYSQYVMSMSFKGVGVEYANDRFRAGGWYGVLRNAVNDDPTDPSARRPQYKRLGWGFKVGYGQGANYIDLYFLRAYDRLKSIDSRWQDKIAPQENIVVGLKGGYQPLSFLSLNANIAASAFSTDTRAEEVTEDVYDSGVWGKVFDTRYTSMARFAGDVSANFMLPNFNAQVFFRLVQPDYLSLGTYYLSNNYQALGLNLSTTLFRRLSLSATLSDQRDNLSNKQLYTTHGYVYSATAATRLAKWLNLAAVYSGYTQRQDDGSVKVNDTTRVNRCMQSFTLTPSASFDTENFSHSVSLAASLTDNKDKNHFATGETDVSSSAVGLTYSLGVKPWATNFTASLSHQESKGFNSKYISNLGSLTANRSFLRDDALNVSATLNLIYNEISGQSKSLSLGCDLSMSYTLAKVHVFTVGASMNKYGDVNLSKRHSGLDATDITASLNYAYTFSLIELKSKSHKQEDKY